MIWWIVALYVVIWVLAIPHFLRARMLTIVCPVCRKRCHGRSHSMHHPSQWKPRGALRPRRGGDVAAAIATAAFWPGFVVLLIVQVCGIALREGITMLVFRATPLTTPEREREERERETALKKREAEIIAALEREL